VLEFGNQWENIFVHPGVQLEKRFAKQKNIYTLEAPFIRFLEIYMSSYDHKSVEAKRAKKWVDKKIFTPDFDTKKDPYYALFMFPYPSAEGLHIGNFYSFANVDVMAKFKRLQGYEVFEPVGWDAFGIHSENYALKIGETPQKMLDRTVANFRKQLQ